VEKEGSGGLNTIDQPMRSDADMSMVAPHDYSLLTHSTCDTGTTTGLRASPPMAPTVLTAKLGTVCPTGALVEKARSKTSVCRWCDGPKLALLTYSDSLMHLEFRTRDSRSSGASTAAQVETGLFDAAPKRLAKASLRSRQPYASAMRDPWRAHNL